MRTNMLPRYGVRVRDLYILREQLGLTQRECAHACGLSTEEYGRIERGRSDPRPATLRRLAQGLHTSLRRLQEGESIYAH